MALEARGAVLAGHHLRLALVFVLSACAGEPSAGAPEPGAPPPANPSVPLARRAWPTLEEEPEIRVLLAEGPEAQAVDEGDLPGELRRAGEGDEAIAVLVLSMESYLRGVVSSEIPSAWGIEEKKAQAIAARSYAIAHLRGAGDYDIQSTTLDQVYRPRENPGAVLAVEETRGQVLVDEVTRDLVEAFYHSTCGGHTEDAAEIWPAAPPHRWATSCESCAASPRYRWQVRLPLARIAAAFPEIEGVDAIRLDDWADSGRVLHVTLLDGTTEHPMDAPSFRRAIGTGILRSAFFETEARGDAIVFRGRGFGHGVGMCQWGAHGMVAEGADHLAILERYYRGTRVHRLYE